jgi:hypothetical protein
LRKIFRDFAFRRTLRGYLFSTVEESGRAGVAGTVKNASWAATEHCHGAWQSGWITRVGDFKKSLKPTTLARQLSR